MRQKEKKKKEKNIIVQRVKLISNNNEKNMTFLFADINLGHKNRCHINYVVHSSNSRVVVACVTRV